jgi:hypothetical protein
MSGKQLATGSQRLVRLFSLGFMLLTLAVPLLGSCRAMISSEESSPNNTTPAPDTTPSATALDIPLDVQLRDSPSVEGTEKLGITDQGTARIIYRAAAANPYNIAAGIILGEFRYYVYTGDARTGGLALAAPVVSRILDTALESMPENKPRWLLTLPLDISDCSPAEEIRIDRNASPFANKPYFIQISAPGKGLGVVNILASRHQIVIDQFPIYGLDYVISQESLDNMKIIEGDEMAFLCVIAALKQKPGDLAVCHYGDRVGVTDEPVLAGLSSVRGPLTVHEYSCILRYEGLPVFLMANDKMIPAGEGDTD